MLCPGISDINLFCYRKRIVYLDPEVSHGALDLRVAKQELDSTQIARSPIDQRRLGSAERMGAKELRVQADAGNPLGNERAY